MLYSLMARLNHIPAIACDICDPPFFEFQLDICEDHIKSGKTSWEDSLRYLRNQGIPPTVTVRQQLPYFLLSF